MPWSPDEEFNEHHQDYDRYGAYRENYVRLKENVNDDMHMMKRTNDVEQTGRGIQKFLQNMDSEIVGDHHQKMMDVNLMRHPYDDSNFNPNEDEKKWDQIYGDQAPEEDDGDRVEARIRQDDMKREEKAEEFEPSDNIFDIDFDYEKWVEENNSSFIGLDQEDKEGDEWMPDKRFSLDGKFELYE
jgi:hypothetical protein